MKIKFVMSALLLISLAACTNTTTTTDAVSDSTAVVQKDTTVVLDSQAVADVPPMDSGTAPTPDATPPSPGDSKTVPANGKVAGGGDPDPLVQTYRITVSFISKGGGIDYKALASWDKFVAGFELKNKVTLAHETVNWGREGEVDYCYKLAELKEPKLSEFVNQCKAQVKDNALILLKENANCRVKRK